MQKCWQVVVMGKVQGVSYRAFVKEKADTLGLMGWVKNQVDGSIKIMALGDLEKLDQLEEMLWDGPPHAEVEDVIVKEFDETPHFNNFEIME